MIWGETRERIGTISARSKFAKAYEFGFQDKTTAGGPPVPDIESDFKRTNHSTKDNTNGDGKRDEENEDDDDGSRPAPPPKTTFTFSHPPPKIPRPPPANNATSARQNLAGEEAKEVEENRDIGMRQEKQEQLEQESKDKLAESIRKTQARVKENLKVPDPKLAAPKQAVVVFGGEGEAPPPAPLPLPAPAPTRLPRPMKRVFAPKDWDENPDIVEPPTRRPDLKHPRLRLNPKKIDKYTPGLPGKPRRATTDGGVRFTVPPDIRPPFLLPPYKL